MSKTTIQSQREVRTGFFITPPYNKVWPIPQILPARNFLDMEISFPYIQLTEKRGLVIFSEAWENVRWKDEKTSSAKFPYCSS